MQYMRNISKLISFLSSNCRTPCFQLNICKLQVILNEDICITYLISYIHLHGIQYFSSSQNEILYRCVPSKQMSLPVIVIVVLPARIPFSGENLKILGI